MTVPGDDHAVAFTEADDAKKIKKYSAKALIVLNHLILSRIHLDSTIRATSHDFKLE